MPNWDTKILEKLLLVQEQDLEIRKLDETIQDLQKRCMQEDPQLNMLKAELNELDETLETTRKQRDLYVNTLDDIQNAIKGLLANRTRAFKPRNRSSTEALRTEEEKLSVLIVETDEQILILEENLINTDLLIKTRTVEVEQANQKPEAEILNLKIKIDSLREIRNKDVADISPPLLRKYDRLSKSRSGIAMTILKNGICGICRMEMPTGIRSKLLKNEHIDSCPACGRMIARVENTIDYTQSINDARLEQEKKMKDEARLALLEEANQNSDTDSDNDSAGGLKSKKSLHRKKTLKKAISLKKDFQKEITEEPESKKAKKVETPIEPLKKSSTKKNSVKKETKNKASTPKTSVKKEPAPVKKEPAKKAPVKKAPAKKVPVKKEPAPVKKEPAKKAPVKKAPAKKAPVKKAPVKKEPAKKAPVKKAPAKKAPVKKAPAKKVTAKKSSSRKKK
ncbi:MAG: hypothetical protein JXR91_00570 [Deltaproteobacteria bacterium]|nr:hypothetical protein [Deltaproteobacteria bacterium]